MLAGNVDDLPIGTMKEVKIEDKTILLIHVGISISLASNLDSFL